MAIETRTAADGKPRYYVRFDTRDPASGAARSWRRAALRWPARSSP